MVFVLICFCLHIVLQEKDIFQKASVDEMSRVLLARNVANLSADTFVPSTKLDWTLLVQKWMTLQPDLVISMF